MTVKIPFPARRLKPLEEQREVEPYPRLHLGDDGSGTRANVSETEVIPGLPDQELTGIEEVNKDARSGPQLVRIKTKKSMPTEDNRTHGGKTKHEGLKPGQSTLSERAEEEKMLQRFHWSTAKTWQRNWQSKRHKALRGVEDPMGDLPADVDNLTVQVEKMESAPRSRPMKRPKCRRKFLDAVW